MSLIERLHTAEHQGREAARERFSRALTNLEEAQSRLRRRMRLHPPHAGKPLTDKAHQPAKPIVTINGRDVPPQDLSTKELANKREQVA